MPEPGGPAAVPAAGRQGAKFLPEFADERNRQLDHDIRALQAELERVQITLEENQEHTQVLSEHLDNVRLEINSTQTRLTARKRELETEAHLRELAARESGRLRSDVARVQARHSELDQKVNSMQTEVFTAGERLNQFKLVQNWNQEELEQWLAAAKQKEDDSLALERYKRQDEALVKDLGMQLERATREANQAKRDLEDEVTETQAAQTELAKAAQDFRRLHEERQELLQQWEGVLEAIKRRDADILQAGQQHAEQASKLAELKQELEAHAAALDTEVAAGAASQKRIADEERGIKALYDAYRNGQAGVAEAEDKADLLGNSLGRAADEAQRQEAANGHLRVELERRQAALEVARGRLDAARVRVQLEGQQLGSLQQKIQELEALQAQEQQRAAALDKELAAFGKQQFQAGQRLHAAQERQRQLASESSGARSQGRNLSHKIAQLEEQLLRQQEVRYNADYQLAQMERKVARAEGHRSKDETEALTARIKQLEGAVEAVQKEHGMLVTEVKRAEDDCARAQRHSLAVQKERDAILDDMSRLEVESSAVARAVKDASKEREDRLVEVDLCRLDVRRLRTLLSSKSGEVVSLEMRKRSLEAGMVERRSEIEMQLELMQGESRLLREEVHRVTSELQARQLALTKLRRKHETLVLKGSSQEGDETHSQAYYIIKAAQERQELAEQAEALQGQIRQAEKECAALEATLRRLVGTNSDMHFHARHSGVQEVLEEQAALREQLDRAAAALKAKLAEEASKSAELEQAQARLANALAEDAGLRQRLELLQKQKADAEQQLQEQLEKRQRAAQRAAKLQRQVQQQGFPPAESTGASAPSLPPALLVADVQLAQVKAATKGMLEALGAAAAELPELNLLSKVESEAGIKLGAEASRPASAASRSLCGSMSASSPGGSRPGSAARSASQAGGSARMAATVSGRSPAASRPGSCAGSVRSGTSARSSPAKQPTVQTVQLTL